LVYTYTPTENNMKIVRDLTYFEVHLADGEDIAELISKISNSEKTYDPEKRIWYICDSNLSYFYNLIKDDKELRLY
jgi:hypothetical protein